MKKIIFGILLFSFIVTDSCKKDSNSPTVPKVYVDELLQLNLPSYTALNTINNWVYVGGGNRGIIVYRKTSTDFIALERTCTYDADNSTAYVEVQSNNITAIDSTCGSKFQITDGSVTHGPASRSLVQYHADYDASRNELHIYN